MEHAAWSLQNVFNFEDEKRKALTESGRRSY